MATLMEQYHELITAILDEILTTQQEKVEEAAELISQTVISGGNLYAFGCAHAGMLTEELFYRAGGLMLINPIFGPGLMLSEVPVTKTSQFERIDGYAQVLLDSVKLKAGDLLILISTSGRNSVPVEMALGAKTRGAKVIALTSLNYTKNVTSRHSSGKKVFEIADLVLDNCGQLGDAVLSIEGLAQKMAPTSTIAGAFILNSVVARSVEKMIALGLEPPVYLSANLDAGDEHNRRLLEQYRERLVYI